MTYDERTRGITLTLLDVDSVIEQATKQLREQYPDAVAEDAKVSTMYDPYAVSERGGKLYVVCNEGVGWEVTEEEPLRLPIFITTPGFMAIAPSFTVTLSPADVRERATGEEIDLVDLVRTFGARLESNFWNWREVLGRP